MKGIRGYKTNNPRFGGNKANKPYFSGRSGE